MTPAAAFRSANLAPVWPARMNVWTLWWVGVPDSTDERVREAVAKQFGRWFGGVGGAILDPLLPSYGSTRSGPADLIRVERWSPQSSFSPSAAASDDDLSPAQKASGNVRLRREQLTVIPMLQTVGFAPLSVRVRFAWRAEQQTIPWPIYSYPALADAYDPLEPQEWMLDRVHAPEGFAPAELTAWQRLTGETLDSAGDAILDATQPAADVAEAVSDVAKPWAIGGVGLVIAGAAIWGLGRVVSSWRR